MRSVQEGCHALFGIFLLLSFTIDFVMSINTRNTSLLVDKGDFADVSMTFFAISGCIFALVCMYIVVNPYFDWKHYGDSIYITVGLNQKGIHRRSEADSDQQEDRRAQSEPKRKRIASD